MVYPDPLDVRRFTEKKIYPLPSDFRNARQVDLIARDRREIDLKIAAVINSALRRIDEQRDRTGDRMVYVDELDTETAELDLVAGFYADELRLVDVLFAQFVVCQSEREFRSVYGHVDLF